MHVPRGVEWMYEGRNFRCVVRQRQLWFQWVAHQAPPWLRLSETVVDIFDIFDDPQQVARSTETN